jgi:hypothetical protein
VTLVRQTEHKRLALGEPSAALGQQARPLLDQPTVLSDAQRTRVVDAVNAAMSNHTHIRTQSTQRTNGKTLRHGKRVNAYDRPMAPSMKGKSNCPAQFGRQTGILSEPSTGFIFAYRVPEGHPSDPSSVVPMRDNVQDAIARVQASRKPQIHSVAGDLGGNDVALRQTLHARGILSIGMPQTVAPINPQPSPEAILACLNEAGLNRQRTPHQVQLACACGSRRPVVESHIASLLARGAGQGRYKGLQGAVVQLGMAVMAHNGAAMVRIRQLRLSTRAQKFRRLLGLRRHKVSEINNSKNQ